MRVPALDGDISMKVTPGTQPGAQLRLRSRGMPRLQQGGRGDQFVHLKVEVPRHLSPRARELLEELREELDRPAGARGRRAAAF